jgi:hypothetical protein
LSSVFSVPANHPAGGVEKRDAHRDQVGMVVAGARIGLHAAQRVAAGADVEMAVDRDMRRARLVVPAHELGEVELRARGDGCHRRDEILAGHRLAVVAAEVFVHARGKRRGRSASGSCG